MNRTTLDAKVGDTFSYEGVHVDRFGEPVDLTGFSIASQIRKRSGELMASLSAKTLQAVEGKFHIGAAPQVTTFWEAGVHAIDVQFTDAEGDVHSTKRFSVFVEGDVTQ